MFGLSTLQLTGAIAGIAFLMGTASGGAVVGKFYVAKEQAAKIKTLETQIAAKDAAAEANSKALAATQGKLAVLDGVTNGLRAKISSGDCFVGDDVDAVLDLLGQSKSAANPAGHR